MARSTKLWMILLPLALGFGRLLVRPGNISKRRRTRANDAVGGGKRRVEVEPSESANPQRRA